MRLAALLFSLLVAMASCQNNAQDKKAVNPNSLTTIQWIDSAVDKGTIDEGQKLEIAFRFRNNGSEPLVIQSVTPSCGCTVADYPKQPIGPGKEGVIKGVFDSHGKPGVNTKSMTVFANTEGTQQHHLSFTVNVQKKS